MNFKVRQKVICIDDSIRIAGCIAANIKKGDVYTVQDIIKCRCGLISLNIGVKSKTGRVKCECGHVDLTYYGHHNDDRFRPLTYSSASASLAASFKETIETSDMPIVEPKIERV